MDPKYRAFAARCLQGPNGTTLRYVGTAATVRDLVGLADAIIGPDSEINSWELSYGTYVGMIFANSTVWVYSGTFRTLADSCSSPFDATRTASAQSYLVGVVRNII